MDKSIPNANTANVSELPIDSKLCLTNKERLNIIVAHEIRHHNHEIKS